MSFHEKLKQNSRLYWQLREWYVLLKIFTAGSLSFKKSKPKNKPRLLFYHLTGLGYGGTETYLQVLAEFCSKEKYEVYFMYSDQQDVNSGMEDISSRLEYLKKSGVKLVRFSYQSIGQSMPYLIYGMNPNIINLIKELDVDLVVTAGSGHANFPFSGILGLPIIFVNVFGQPNLQKNIKFHLCISSEVAGKLKKFIPEEKIKITYVPSRLPLAESVEAGKKLRQSLGIKDSDLVFGRIGRSSDSIFDPIGIEAFSLVVKKYPNIHYLIVSPSPRLKQLVGEQKIPNIHFLPDSGLWEKLWEFYYAIDILAHFRLDGESFGLNIAQAMLCGRPIISHRSKFWNAHLEYLTDDFSRVADSGDTKQYAEYMEWFITKWQAGELVSMGEKAKAKALTLVDPKLHSQQFEEYVKASLS